MAFQKGQSGNPQGRRPGTRNLATQAVEALLEGEAEALTRKAVELALAGDTTALRLCLERIAPPRKGRPILLDIGDVATLNDLSGVQTKVALSQHRCHEPPLRAGMPQAAENLGSSKHGSAQDCPKWL